jgi:hypothetical protein
VKGIEYSREEREAGMEVVWLGALNRFGSGNGAHAFRR